MLLSCVVQACRSDTIGGMTSKPDKLTVFVRAALLTVVAFASGSCTPTAETPAPTSGTVSSPTATDARATATSDPAPTLESTCPAIDTELRDRLDQIESQVERLRGLQPMHAVSRGQLTTSQLRVKVEQDFLSDYSVQESERDALILSMLDLVEPGLDLHALYTELLAEQIAGFYDIQEEELVVVCDAGTAGLQVFAYVHEYVHALQDQTYSLETGLNFSDEECDLAGERCLALRALIEGDATLLQEQWLRTYADAALLSELLASLGDLNSPAFDSAPAYIRAELTFPYLAGLSFVRAMYLENDWMGIDAVYQNPPVSSEQILHPDRYPRDVPIALSAPPGLDALEDGWNLTAQIVLGEWTTRQVLREHLAEEVAQETSAGWGGDLLLLFETPERERVALALITQWDTVRDAHEATSGLFEYGVARFGEPAHRTPAEATWVFDGGASQFIRQSNQTRWIIAPDGEALSLFQSVLPLSLATSQ